MNTKTTLACLMLAAAAIGLALTPGVAADSHCPPPAEPSPNPVEGAARTAQAAARSACMTLATACETAGVDSETCWITLE